MSAPRLATRDALARALDGHQHVPGGCSCGWTRNRWDAPSHPEHQADALLASGAVAAALTEGGAA